MSTIQVPVAPLAADTRLIADHAPTPLVEIQNVSKSFPGPVRPVQALRDVRLELRPKELVALIGHSRTGKSTLLNIIAGLQRPTQGQVLFAGKPITGPGPERALVSQHSSLLPWHSVYQNIYEAVERSHPLLTPWEKQARVYQHLERAGLTPHLHKRLQQLASGVRHRVAIVRAFAAQPNVLLVDDLFSTLDQTTRSTLQELLRVWRHATEIETVVLVTHDIDEAIYLSDRIVVLGRGAEPTIREVLPVALPRPRNKCELIQTAEWSRLKERVTTLLYETSMGED